jgi:hypothetical protein
MNKECPVDFIAVNENKVRLVALWVLLLVLVTFIISPLPVFIFLAVDFFLRAFNYGKFSPLNLVSGMAVKQFKIANKPIDQAPKRFAAGIGFALSATVVLFLLLQHYTAVLVLTIVFASFAFLESFLGFCAGCYVYTFLQQIKFIR